MEEIALASEALRGCPGVDKINVGALGNIVRQLHVHVVARTIGDAAWPGPVWGSGAAELYQEQEALQRVDALCRALGLNSARYGARRSSLRIRNDAGRPFGHFTPASTLSCAP